MCFTEFIGYTCGHTSVEVLRPCPLTTQFHANPICATYGRRSILAQEMCPACHRIIHGRAVLILEWEHHWMHERGVCGCPVIFPDLIKPRIVVPSTPGVPAQSFRASAPVANNNLEKSRNKNNGKAQVAAPKQGPLSKKGGRSRKKKFTAAQDILQTGGCNKTVESSTDEGQSFPDQPGGNQPHVPKRSAVRKKAGGSQQVGNTTGQNIPPTVHARIHSLYGVEWIEEHRQLHNTGSCKCAADFSYYQTPEVYGITESSSLEVPDAQEQAVPMADHNHFPMHTSQDVDAWGQILGCSSQPTQASSYGCWSQGIQQSHQFQTYHPHQSYDPCFPNGYARHFQQGAQAGEWSTAQQEPGLPANIGQPARSSGAIHQVDLTKSTNPLYNYACIEGGKQGGRMGRCVDMLNLDYIRAKDAPPPLVGLPIGAGPEAPEYMEHIGSFADCVLHPNNKGKQRQQTPQTQGATGPEEVTKLQQAQGYGQIGNENGSQVVEGLLAAANDNQHSRLLRLTHKKSASAAYARLSWDDGLHSVLAGSDFAHSVRNKDGSG